VVDIPNWEGRRIVFEKLDPALAYMAVEWQESGQWMSMEHTILSSGSISASLSMSDDAIKSALRGGRGEEDRKRNWRYDP